MGSAAELLLGELRTKLDGQLATLESLRTRAAVVLSVSGVIAGLFVPHFSHAIGDWSIAAIAAFVVGALPAIAILWPHKMTTSPQGDDWIRFANENKDWVAGQLQTGEPDPEASLDLGAADLAARMISTMNNWYKTNEPRLTCLHKALAASAAGVVVQLACWGGAAIGIHF